MAKDDAAAKKAAWAKAANQAKGSWKSARKAKAGEFTEEPEIEDGTYQARLVNASAGVTKKSSIPYVRLVFLIVEDCDYKGDKHSRMDFLLDDDDEKQAAKQASFAKCMSGMGYDVEELEMTDIPDLVDDLNKERPFVEVWIKNWQGEKSHGKNVNVNRQLTEDEVASLDLDPEDGDGDSEKDAPKKTPPSRGGAARKKAAAPKGAKSRR